MSGRYIRAPKPKPTHACHLPRNRWWRALRAGDEYICGCGKDWFYTISPAGDIGGWVRGADNPRATGEEV